MANDVVFPKIGAGLHLDQMQIHLAMVFDLMANANRNIDGLAFVKNAYLVVNRYPPSPGNRNPMFRAMKMALQGYSASRVNGQVPNLKAILFGQGFALPPRAVVVRYEV